METFCQNLPCHDCRTLINMRGEQEPKIQSARTTVGSSSRLGAGPCRRLPPPARRSSGCGHCTGCSRNIDKHPAIFSYFSVTDPSLKRDQTFSANHISLTHFKRDQVWEYGAHEAGTEQCTARQQCTDCTGCTVQCSSRVAGSDDPVPISEPRQSLIAPCLGLGAHEAIAGYTEFSLQRCQ